MIDTRRFFCAECGAKFTATAYIVKGQYGQELISCEDACPHCGGRDCHPDTEQGHREELASTLAYDDDLAAADLDEEV